MCNNEFKEGDLVFRLSRTKGVLLETLKGDDNDWLDIGGQKVDKLGFLPHQYSIPYAIHATPENRQALITLYGEDAVPELPLRGSELTKKLLESQKYVLCYCSDTSDDDCRKYKSLLVVDCFEDGHFFEGGHSAPFENWWNHAVPVDMNGNEITEI